MQITSTVKIGGIVYRIIECSNPSEEDHNVDGMIVYHKQELRLKKDVGYEYKENVFMHEIIHGVLELTGIEQDENLVVRLSNAIHQVIKDNPDIFKS